MSAGLNGIRCCSKNHAVAVRTVSLWSMYGGISISVGPSASASTTSSRISPNKSLNQNLILPMRSRKRSGSLFGNRGWKWFPTSSAAKRRAIIVRPAGASGGWRQFHVFEPLWLDRSSGMNGCTRTSATREISPIIGAIRLLVMEPLFSGRSVSNHGTFYRRLVSYSTVLSLPPPLPSAAPTAAGSARSPSIGSHSSTLVRGSSSRRTAPPSFRP